MTVISGETGAGKSLLVDALGFLSGARADAGVVRHGAQRAELDAEFALTDAPLARAWLADAEPVSYTHLDVYKRQSMPLSAATFNSCL